MSGLETVASALNANDQCLARIAAVHLQIPDLPSLSARDALAAEDLLIKYARDEGGSTNWNPALHPRTGTPPSPGWFASVDGPQHESSQDISNQHDARLRFVENQDSSRRTDAAPQPTNRSSRHRATPLMSRRISPTGSARGISRSIAIFGPPFGHPSGTGCMNRCLSMT